MPDIIKGPNSYLTDRIDGLITDTTNSPFTTVILPYKYIANPDAKIKWNAFSYDEGLASRVPYEAAARVLTQTKRSYAAFAVRHGLAIEMEHNFMVRNLPFYFSCLFPLIFFPRSLSLPPDER
jgi:hypothetical protein